MLLTEVRVRDIKVAWTTIEANEQRGRYYFLFVFWIVTTVPTYHK